MCIQCKCMVYKELFLRRTGRLFWSEIDSPVIQNVLLFLQNILFDAARPPRSKQSGLHHEQKGVHRKDVSLFCYKILVFSIEEAAISTIPYVYFIIVVKFYICLTKYHKEYCFWWYFTFFPHFFIHWEFTCGFYNFFCIKSALNCFLWAPGE